MIMLSSEADSRYEKAIKDMSILRKKGKLKTYTSVSEFMEDLK